VPSSRSVRPSSSIAEPNGVSETGSAPRFDGWTHTHLRETAAFEPIDVPDRARVALEGKVAP